METEIEKLDLVYILGKQSRWGDNEIRYSLRSVKKYFPNYRQIFVVGEKPKWLTNIIHIPAKDPFSIKIINAKEKILLATKDKRVSKRFILMNDDFFFNKLVAEIKIYFRGTCEEMIKRHPTHGGYYYKSLVDTKRKIQKLGIPIPKDFEIHYPVIFEKEKVATVLKLINNGNLYFGIRTFYGNMVEGGGRKVIDFKAQNLAEFAYQTKRNAEMISINDKLAGADEVRTWLQRKFPHPSEFELDEGRGVENYIEPSKTRFVAARRFTYGSMLFNIGDSITVEILEKIKNNRQMAHLWKKL